LGLNIRKTLAGVKTVGRIPFWSNVEHLICQYVVPCCNTERAGLPQYWKFGKELN
jgi:hypothetical protein